MGCNIPRPIMRPRTPNADGILGVLTAKEILQYSVTGGIRKDPEPAPDRSPYNCPNCCAPIVKPYCEYCGTRFGFSIVKVDGVPKREEIEKIKERLYSDDRIVYEFDRFHEVASNLTKYQR